MRRLIINADDLGADSGRNMGIMEGIKAGVITSVSVLPNGPASQEAMEWLQKDGMGSLSVGLHLNLSEGRPLSSGVSLLTGSDGCFLGKEACHRLLLKEEDQSLRKEVALELQAQFQWALSWGVPITHVNGHQHVHVFPAVLETLIEYARNTGIAWVRLPLEEKPLVQLKADLLAQAEALTFNRVARGAWRKILDSGLCIPDFFCGLYWKGRLSLRLFNRMLGRLPHGLTELMVHPGRVAPRGKKGPFSGFSGHDRERELQALLNPKFRVMLKKYEVILTGFPKGDQSAWLCGS